MFSFVLRPDTRWKSSRAVVLVHGLLLRGVFMLPLALRLRRDGHHALIYEYPSSLRRLDGHAQRFNVCLNGIQDLCPSVGEVNFVTHSLGSLIVRQALSECPRRDVRRVVMLGPPNHGSPLAGHWMRIFPPSRFMVKPLSDLDSASSSPVHELPVPRDVEIGVIAGSKSRFGGVIGRIDGVSDGKVAVESTHLAGEKDHVVLPVSHTAMLWSGRVIGMASRFLDHGRFGQ